MKALYGCRTAPREWYKTLKEQILSQGFQSTLLDPCLFVRGARNALCLIFIYVDDMLIFTTECELMKEINRFKCIDLGEIGRFLGVWIDRANMTPH